MEETDLIRALHAHEGVYDNCTAEMSVAVDKLRELGMDLNPDPEREER
jgi:hypothetical protein